MNPAYTIDIYIYSYPEVFMNLFELFLVALSLSMDAFAVSLCKGLSAQALSRSAPVVTGLYFGGFQAFMPLLGHMLGAQFADKIVKYDHWIIFILLALIGGKMIHESFQKIDDAPKSADPASFGARVMLPLAVATSVDALAVGVSFAILNVDIVPAVTLIGLITFILSFAGVKLGSLLGAAFRSKAEFFGGVVLVLMGGKILIEHLFPTVI